MRLLPLLVRRGCGCKLDASFRVQDSGSATDGDANLRKRRATMAQSLLGLGSNLGDREATLDSALRELERTEGVRLIARSQWHRFEPVGGPPGQGEYLNGVALLETSLSPPALLRVTQQIETQFGRQRGQRWAARTLDIDLLLYDDLVIDTPELSIPHPRLAVRPFVLDPAVEIAADWVHPTLGQSLAELREQLDCGERQALE